MSKFKFGDKVWHDEFGVCIYHHSLGYKNMCRVLTETNGSKKVSEHNLKKVSDWIQCSGRMPDIDVEVLVYFDGYIYIDSLYYDKNLKEYWWQGNCRLPTHWIPLPEMPEVK